MDNNNFIDILMSNDNEEVAKYLITNGKKKSYSPIFFEKTPNNNQEDKQNE